MKPDSHSQPALSETSWMKDAIFRAALFHAKANDDIAYEVGDLQDAFTAAWNHLPPDRQRAVFQRMMKSFGTYLGQSRTKRAIVLGFVSVHGEKNERDLFEARAWNVHVSPLRGIPDRYVLREVHDMIYQGKPHVDDWDAAHDEAAFRRRNRGALVLDFAEITTDYALHNGFAPGVVIDEDDSNFHAPEAWLRPWTPETRRGTNKA